MRVPLLSWMLVVPCSLVLSWPPMSASVFADEATKAPPAAESATPPAKSPAASSEGKPSLGLDSLLRPRGPARAPVKRELPGGRDRDAWKQAFDDTRKEIRDLEAALDKARKEVSERSQGGGLSVQPHRRRQ